jgi:hypothetical protein
MTITPAPERGARASALGVLLEQRGRRQPVSGRVSGRALLMSTRESWPAAVASIALKTLIVLAHVAGEQLEHAGDVVAVASGRRRRRAARVAGGAGPRLLRVGAHVGDPGGAAKAKTRPGRPRPGRAGPPRAWAKALTAGPASGAIQEAPQRSVGPSPSGSQTAPQASRASRPARRGRPASALRALAVGEVVGDRPLGEQQPVRLALGAARARAGQLALHDLGTWVPPRRRSGLETLDHRGEVAVARSG